MVAVLDFGDGLLAHFDCGFNQSSRQRAIIAGEDCFMVLRDVFLPGTGETRLQIIRDGEQQVQTFKGVDEYRLIAEDFMRAAETGRPSTPGSDAIANLSFIQALIASARAGGQTIDL
jgi:predicted dehydrogenase